MEVSGWLLDLYSGTGSEIAIWLLGEDGQRHCFHQAFPIHFYAAGPPPVLRRLQSFLETHEAVQLSHQERRDLFQPTPIPLLAVQVAQPAAQFSIFQQVERIFPDLTYYDVDIPLSIRHTAAWGTFPLAHCRLEVDENSRVQEIEVLDTRWETDPHLPELKIFEMLLDTDPRHGQPQEIEVRYGRSSCTLQLDAVRPLLINLTALLRRFDPDILLTSFGDSWLLPHLFECSQQAHLPVPFSRDPLRTFDCRAARSYFSYGQIVFRGQQIRLYGRLHIDQFSTLFWKDYGLDGILETARVTCLPIQGAARLSPGTGISAMQMVQALQDGILVPWHKQQVEAERSALSLLRRDRGGIVYQPTVGLHTDVAELDYISMYPSIMVAHNISPETTPSAAAGKSSDPPGLIPRTLSPLLVKRILLKQRLAKMPSWDPRRKHDQACISAHKWLLVTCFGYLGYKNARFGQISSHEAVTESGREALLSAKEVVEEMGFSVLHMYVDGLWVRKEDAHSTQDYQELVKKISERTGMQIALDGIYRWICFLPSRMDQRVPVGNRYFGVFQDGTLKTRGIEARRKDTPPWIARTQMEMLEYLAASEDTDHLNERVDGALRILQKRLAQLRRGTVPLEELLVSQRLSRELAAYRSLPPAARAALQLRQIGQFLQPGEKVRFLYVLGDPGVYAWDLPQPPDPRTLDRKRYQELLLRAAETILQPFGIDSAALRSLTAAIPARQKPIPGLNFPHLE